jgi:hypothetical protein
MTAPNLIAIVGGGSVLAMAGFILLGAAAGVLLAVTVPAVSLGVWLLIVGGVMLVLGLMLVERGGTKSVEKVEKELSMPNVVKNFPWTFVAAGVGSTLFFVWLFRKRSPAELATKPEVQRIVVPMPTGAPPQPPPAPKRTTLADVMLPLGTAAASYASSVAMKALGVPTPQEMLGSLVKGFFSGDHGQTKSEPQNRAPSHNGYEAAMQRT